MAKVTHFLLFPTHFAKKINTNNTFYHMDKGTELKEIFYKLKALRIVSTQEDMAKLLNVNRTSLNKAMNNVAGYDSGNILRSAITLYEQHSTEPLSERAPTTQDNTDEPLIPVIPYKLYRESNVDLNAYFAQREIPRQRAVAQFPPHDCYYFVNTSAMEPSFMPSDLLALREVRRGTPIINGDPYMLNIAGHGMELRFLYDRSDCFELRAMSQRHEPSLVPKTKVVNLFRIIGLIRTNM